MIKSSKKQPKSTKSDKITALLLRSKAATLVELARCANWQPHSVRGFMSGSLKKKLGFEVTSKREEGKSRRYFIVRGAK